MAQYDLIIRGGTIVDGTGAPAFTGDVAIKDGLIAMVGTVTGSAPEEIDATGKVVTPGFVDIHTHYDGQATWDQEMAPSSWHGVTTVVMGNCGVGFAPAKPDRRAWLISLMEGVEDIPGTALAEGITWDWETFPEYLDALEKLPRTVDIGTHVPHGAVRAYVLGEREQPGAVPTAEDIAEMSRIVEEGVRAGALGFSTSRTVLHKSVNGELVPGTTATPEELIAIGKAMGRAAAAGGHAVFEMASDLKREWNEFAWMGKLSREAKIPVTFAALQSIAKELPLDEQIALMRAENDNGANIVAQIALRGNGIIMAWQGTVNPFAFRPSWQAIKELPWEAQQAKLLDPAFKAALLAAHSVLYNRASSGMGVEKMIQNLGLSEALAARTQRFPNAESVMKQLIAGEPGDLAMGAPTAISLYTSQGLRYVGPIPADLQSYTAYGVALTPGASPMARKLMEYLATPEARKIFAAKGVTPQ